MTETRRDADAAPAQENRRQATERLSGWRTPLVVSVVVGLLALFPLIKNRIFYFWDDSAAAFLPYWHEIGNQLLSGTWPVLRPDMWMGGNLAGEAQISLWNPVSLLNYVLVALLPDLAVAATMVKIEFMIVLALGVYFLAREYGAKEFAAAVVAISLPVSGYTLYVDASAWVAGLIGFAYLTHFWWSLRRFSRGRLNPIVPFVFGALAMTTGNPYGALGVIVVLLVIGVERLLIKDIRKFWELVLVGGAVGMTGLVAFLPLLTGAAVTWRQPSGIYNSGFMVPGLGDLLAMSSPTYLPRVQMFEPDFTTFPMAYLAWFILPLAPWLSFRAMRARLRERFGIFLFGTIYLLMTIAPSDLWLFRWPARLIQYVYLPVCVLVAIALSVGLRTSNWRRRALGSAALIFVGTYQSWAQSPQNIEWHAPAFVLAAGGTAAAVWVVFKHRAKLLPPVLVTGTALVLLMQVLVMPMNGNVTPWYFPHNVAELKDRFADRYTGNTLQVAEIWPAIERHGYSPNGAWRDLLFGNMYHVAGVKAQNSYTGIGYNSFANALCMEYHGGVCPESYNELWKEAGGTGRTLADLMRLETVVVLNGFVPGFDASRPPAGWSVRQTTDIVTVLHRDAKIDWPQGRLANAAPGVRVGDDLSTGFTGETMKYSGSGRVTFAMLAWPGWSATVDGKPLEVRQGPAGLLQLDLPQSANGTVQLRYFPPGWSLGIPLLGFGVLVGVGFSVLVAVRKRRPRTG
ncbi:hypothetical protein [Allokutzneria oryzae]|uniref:hypothetical protein n=1 Tax=Allokutzneria oryzae TaxID=1378989 RepID=UPI00366D4ADA